MILPTFEELVHDVHVVSLPMTTRFRGVDAREALIFRGPQGWTEFSPFAEYDDAEAATWLSAAIEYGWRELPAAVRSEVRVNATMPAVAAESVADVMARFDGCRTVKVKVAETGQSLADDIARVRAVRDLLGPEGRVRVDANGGWNVDEAEHAVRVLAEFDLEYVEQPCTELEELAELRQRVRYLGVPIAADESVRKVEDPLAVARAGAADILVIKAQPLGGVRRALQLASAAGLPVVVSSALDTSVGLAMGVALAAALPSLDYDCGLATASLFAHDVVDPPLAARSGILPVGRVTPDLGQLESLAASPERRDWWLARLSRCYAVLRGSEPTSTPAT